MDENRIRKTHFGPDQTLLDRERTVTAAAAAVVEAVAGGLVQQLVLSVNHAAVLGYRALGRARRRARGILQLKPSG